MLQGVLSTVFKDIESKDGATINVSYLKMDREKIDSNLDSCKLFHQVEELQKIPEICWNFAFDSFFSGQSFY